MSAEGARKRQTSFVLSDDLISALDKLKPVYGVRSRGAVVEHLLEHLLEQGSESSLDEEDQPGASSAIEEASSLVLIQRSGEILSEQPPQSDVSRTSQETSGIDLPGFVRNRTRQLKQTLARPIVSEPTETDPVMSAVRHDDLLSAQRAAEQHWRSLYG